MVIESLTLQNFRNYEELDMNFSPMTNILYGDNAQGKTNILESLYVSGTSKSHKGAKDKDLIYFGKEEAHIRVMIDKSGKKFQIDLHLKKNKSKGIAINKIPIKKASDLFGILNIVFFSPEDLNIVKNGPNERRKFLDLELCQLDKIYLSNLTKYNKILQQRNKLLKDIYYKPELKDTLSIWDMQLVGYGCQIIESRDKFIRELNPIVTDIHSGISGGKERMLLEYEPNITSENFENKLMQSLERDLKMGQTSVGPHRDDFSFMIDSVDIRKYGSQGQQRTSALALKLAEIELVRNVIHDSPVLLLDDVLSELDSNRQNFLLNCIHSTQTIITCTGLEEFIRNQFHLNRVFEVINGKVFEK